MQIKTFNTYMYTLTQNNSQKLKLKMAHILIKEVSLIYRRETNTIQSSLHIH